MTRARVWWWTMLAAVAVHGAGFAPPPRPDKPIVAKVPGYRVAADLSNVSNAKQLPTLTAAQRQALSGQGFFAQTTREEQLFTIYENNHYKRVPSFVTTDSVLHTWHVFYDFALRWLETGRLIDYTKQFCQRMVDLNLAGYRAPHTPALHQAYGANLIDFALAQAQFGKTPDLPAELRPRYNEILGWISAHDGWHNFEPDRVGDLARINTTQFIPRGHYTRSEDLKQYFMAMMWLGLMGRPIDPRLPDYTTRSLLLTHQLASDEQARGLWRRVYEPTAFMVGVADDLTFEDLEPYLRRCFDPDHIDSYGDPARLAEFWKLTPKLRQQGIENAPLSFKVMGQRFILDSRIFQELCWGKVGTDVDRRAFPLALDVPAVLGSQRAASLLDDFYREPRYANYLAQRAKLQAEVAALSPSDWDQNLYYAWLQALRPLLEPKGEGWPKFMQTPAWVDKQLVCFLGSWTELRHDTILYAKQSTVECGGDGVEPPPPVPGFVEPEVAVYERLARLLRMSRDGLKGLGLLSVTGEGEHISYTGEYMASEFSDFAELLDWLAAVSRKELAGAALTRDDLRGIENYGARLEALMIGIMAQATGKSHNSWFDIESRTDRNMALVADVHTGGIQALTEAVGEAAEMWVVVPIGGKLVAARGATFAWHEFKVPAAQRLTDEAWQKQLGDGKAPPMPSWTSSVFIGPGVKTRSRSDELVVMRTGC